MMRLTILLSAFLLPLFPISTLSVKGEVHSCNNPGNQPLAHPTLERPDTIPVSTDTVKTRQLQEVVVEGDDIYARRNSWTYIPAKQMKYASTDAIDLLNRLSIPQIRVNPIGKTVTTSLGDDVTIFVNHVKASAQDIQGMRMADVKKVEYLDFPEDPRYLNVAHAINITVAEYEYGGYTKLTDSQYFLNSGTNYATLFSKFTYRAMTYDLFTSATAFSNSKVGSSSSSTFILPEQTVTRTTHFMSGDQKGITVPVTLRATYVRDNLQIQNTVGFKFADTYRNLSTGSLEFAPSDAGREYAYRTSTPRINRDVTWNGMYYFQLPHSLSITAFPSVAYTHANTYSRYTTDVDDPQAIVNDALEDILQASLTTKLGKRFGQRHTLSANIDGFFQDNHVRYTGGSPYRSKFIHKTLNLGAGYSANMEKVTLRGDLGLEYEYHSINGEKEDHWYPTASLYTAYSPDTRNQFNARLRYQTNTPGIAMRSPNVIQVNELMYNTGNPDLKNWSYFFLDGGYVFMPSQKYYMSVFGRFSRTFDKLTERYSLYDGGKGVLREYFNGGTNTRAGVGGDLIARLLQNRLYLQLEAQWGRSRITTPVEKTYSSWWGFLQAQYYTGPFSFYFRYELGERNLDDESGAITRYPNSFSLNMTYAIKDFNVGLSASNIFRKSYTGSRTDLLTPVYRAHTETITPNYRAGIIVWAIYTFGYGRKINRGNEVGAQKGADSAIMK